MTTLPATRSRVIYRDDQRADYAAGLRALADLIEANTDVPFPSAATMALWTSDSDDEKRTARELLRKIGGNWTKKESIGGTELIFQGWLHGLPIDVWVTREAVCERRVVGTREVIETVPVGEDTRPTETVTRTEDIVEWVCSPLLSDAPSEASEVSA